MGYVATAGRGASDIIADVATYAGWNTNYSVDGVFFDGISATAELLPSNAALVQEAMNLFGEDTFVRYSIFRGLTIGLTTLASQIMLNASGPPETSDYYALPVSQIISLETAYDDFRCGISALMSFDIAHDDNSQSLLTLDVEHPPSKQAIILHNAPNTQPNLTFLRELVLQDQLESMYWTDLPFTQMYDQFIDLVIGISFFNAEEHQPVRHRPIVNSM